MVDNIDTILKFKAFKLDPHTFQWPFTFYPHHNQLTNRINYDPL